MKENEINPSFSNLMYENRSFPPPAGFQEKAHLNSIEQYQQMYRRSIEDSDAFWLEQAEKLHWFKKPSSSCEYLWNSEKRRIEHKWFADGVINVCYNCVDRHLDLGRGNKTAFIWQGDDDSSCSITYQELHDAVCRLANGLKAKGIKKGDRVCIYLPMIPEIAIATLACARIGAIHSVIFAGFSAESIAHRIQDSSCKMIITSNVSLRGGKQIPLKEIVDEALLDCASVDSVIVVKRDQNACPFNKNRDTWYDELIDSMSPICPAEPLNAEDPLFILYTSGSTGKPKGVVHTQAGYLLHAALTHYYIFDIQENDIYWCTADVGWITGHSYIIYGPLANGATCVIFEGIPTFPSPARFWQVIEKFQVSVFYTAPTVVRALIRHGESWPQMHDLSSLRLLGTVGEPINPEAWMWFYEVIGKGKCPIVDTWWQTETGAILIAPIPGCHTLKPGSASMPFFGIKPLILQDDGTVCHSSNGGSLCIERPWPGIMRTTWGDHERFIDTYFSTFADVYFTGDGARIDESGNYFLLGRIDDVVNVSGHRLGTAEIESSLVSHEAVAEAAVVPIPHELKGQGLHAFVTVVKGVSISSDLQNELREHVKQEIGAIAAPDVIQFARSLPKTRSGKIMRRILRKIAEKNLDELGDISTLADPSVIAELTGE